MGTCQKLQPQRNTILWPLQPCPLLPFLHTAEPFPHPLTSRARSNPTPALSNSPLTLMTLSSDIYAAKSRCYFPSTHPGHRSHPTCLVIFSQKRATFQTPILLLPSVASSSGPLCWSPCGKQELSSVPPLSRNTPLGQEQDALPVLN